MKVCGIIDDDCPTGKSNLKSGVWLSSVMEYISSEQAPCSSPCSKEISAKQFPWQMAEWTCKALLFCAF